MQKLLPLQKSEKNLIALQAVIDTLEGFPTSKARGMFLRDQAQERPSVLKYLAYACDGSVSFRFNTGTKLREKKRQGGYADLMGEPALWILEELAAHTIDNPAAFYQEYRKQHSREAATVLDAIIDRKLGAGLITRRMLEKLLKKPVRFLAEPYNALPVVSKTEREKLGKKTHVILDSTFYQGRVLSFDVLLSDGRDELKCGTLSLIDYMEAKKIIAKLRKAGIEIRS